VNGSLGCFSWFPLSLRFISWIWHITLQTYRSCWRPILIVNFWLSGICSLLRNAFMSHQEQLRESEAKQKKPRYTLSLSLVCEYWIFLTVFLCEKKIIKYSPTSPQWPHRDRGKWFDCIGFGQCMETFCDKSVIFLHLSCSRG